MGLSGRRRARKPAGARPSTNATAATAAGEGEARSDRRRSGNTLRRLGAEARKEMRHAQALKVTAKRRPGQVQLLPDMPPQYHEYFAGAPAAPNRNHWNRDILSLPRETLDTKVSYSLKKRGRWAALDRLQEDYEEEEELQSVNLFLLEAVGLPRGGRTRRLVANSGHVTEAAHELRSHKNSLKPKRSGAGAGDNFEFSDRVRHLQQERPLRRVGAKSSATFVNEASAVHSFNLWSRLYNVSPQAEAQRTELQREYEQRPEVVVQLLRPGAECRRTGWEGDRERRHLRRTEVPDRLRRDGLRDSLHLQLHCDQAHDCCEDQLLEEEQFVEEEKEEEEARSSGPTLLDFFVAQPTGRQQKKKAAKAAKARKAAKVAKARNDSGRTDTSGYSSGRSELTEEEEEQQQQEEETAAVDARAVAAVQESLTAPRPTVSLPKELASPARLAELFGDAGDVCIRGASWPTKVAVALRPELTEFAVFEECGCSAERRSFSLRHSAAAGVEASTSLEELAGHADPFLRLKELLDKRRARAEATEATEAAAKAAKASGCLSGWQRGRVLQEAAAQSAALRQLPMFHAAAADVDDPEIVAAECDICCRQFADADAVEFADAWTALAGCGHSFCNGCWTSHIVLGVAGGATRLTCPAFGCPCVLDAATLLWFCPAELLPALRQAAFAQWLRGGSDGRQLRGFCRNHSCGRLLQAAASCNVVCDTCRQGVCLRCRGEPHWPADCSAATQYQQQMQQLGHTKLNVYDLTSEATVQAKNCPRCQLIIEKGPGCNHMSCPCGEHFCWWCGRPLSEHTGGSGICYNNGKGRSTFSVEKVFRAEDSLLVPSSRQSRLYCGAVRQRLQRHGRQLLAAKRRSVADLFFAFGLRVEGASVKEAARTADARADELLLSLQQAGQLVEFAFVSLDRRRCERRRRLLCLALGSHVGDLVAMATDAVRELPSAARHRRLQPPRRQRASEQARMLLQVMHQLRVKCQALNCAAREPPRRRLLLA